MPAQNRRLPEWEVLETDFSHMSTRAVAEKYGVHIDHLRRIRRQKFIYQKDSHRPYDGDPRDFIKEPYRSFVTDERVAKWKETGECMCGCGTICSIRTNRKFGPIGTRGFFARGHMRSLAKGHITGEQPIQATPQARRAYSEGRRAYLVDSTFIMEDVEEYLRDNGMTQTEFCARANLPLRSLQYYLRHKPMITRANAAKLLTGLGQEIPAYYKERPDHFKPKKIVVPKASQDPFAHLNHYLLHDGKVHIDYLGVVLAGRASSEVGKAKCSCGTLSPVLHGDHERKRWHKQHKAEKTQMDKAS